MTEQLDTLAAGEGELVRVAEVVVDGPGVRVVVERLPGVVDPAGEREVEVLALVGSSVRSVSMTGVPDDGPVQLHTSHGDGRVEVAALDGSFRCAVEAGEWRVERSRYVEVPGSECA